MPGLHHEILSIILPESAAEEKRRTDIYNTVRSLDDLMRELNERGYYLKRTTSYYRYDLKNYYFSINIAIPILRKLVVVYAHRILQCIQGR